MDLLDALTVSALGMSVVFAGLMLTALLIFALGRLPGLAAKLRTIAREPEPAPGEPSPPPAVDPAVVVVVAAVLEVERRLHRAEQGGRLTIERTP